MDASASVQSGNVQQDTKGNTNVVVGKPAFAASANLTLNGPKPDQKVLASPSVGVFGFVSVSRDLVKDDDGGKVHFQGATVTFSFSTPTSPVSVAIPPSTFRRIQGAVQRFLGIEPTFNPSSVPWSNTQIM